MVIFSIPESVKGRIFYHRTKKSQNLLTSVINLWTVPALSTLSTLRFHVTKIAVYYLTLSDDVSPSACGTSCLLELRIKVEKDRKLLSINSLLLPRGNSPEWAKTSSLSRIHNHTQNASQSVGHIWTSDQPDADTSTWKHTTIIRDTDPYPRWDSNPQSPQASGRRSTPYTARPVGPAYQ
jgi:hypothetical protein